jgi:hypothetical protein
MSFFDRLLGRDPQDVGSGAGARTAELSEDQAIERYRYMLRTAPPEDIERAHEEAFAALAPEQRALVLRELSAQVPPSERATSDDPRSLARMATRAEIRRPGTIERTFGAVPGGPGLGGMFLSGLAGAFLGTAIASSFFNNDAGFAGDTAGMAGTDDAGTTDTGGDAAGEYDGGFGDADLSGGGGFGDGGDIGGDFGDFGGGDL